MKTAIITDSTSSLPESLASHPDVYVIHLRVIYPDGHSLEETTDETILKTYYSELKSMETLPTTSQPSVGEVYDVMESLVEKGYDQVLVMTMSSALSGTFQNCQLVAGEYQDKLKIRLIDTRQTGLSLAYLFENGLKLVAELDLDTAVERLKWLDEQMVIYVTVRDLNNLVKGGRASKSMVVLGNLLKILPLIYVQRSGELGMSEKIRTCKKVIHRMVEIIHEEGKMYEKGYQVCLLGTPEEDSCQQIQEMIQNTDWGKELEIRYATIPPVIGTHLGSGSFGFCVLPKIENCPF